MRERGLPGLDLGPIPCLDAELRPQRPLRALLGQSAITAYANNPKYFNTDVTLQKRVRFGAQSVRVTLEAFNVFNWMNFANPDGNLASGNFGKITSVVTGSGSPRVVQLGVKFMF